jgi:hypothetical protein
MSEFGDIYDVLVEYILDHYRMEIDRLAFPDFYKGGEEDVEAESAGGTHKNKQTGDGKYRNNSKHGNSKRRAVKRVR